MKTSSKIIGGIIVVLVGIAVYFYETMTGSSVVTNNNQPVTPVVDNTPTTPTTPAKSGKYKNGTYNVTDTYFTPAGREQIGVALTILGDKITSATVTPMANGGDSKMYQMRFANMFSGQVIGMNIDSLKIDTSSGSSLTTGAFNDALTQIRKQALN
jgi:uncharacterized protein with FMN-binding domain